MGQTKNGQLILLPTPLDEASSFNDITLSWIQKEIQEKGEKRVRVIGEEIKTLRRFWLRSKLPREMVEDFLILNEHNQESSAPYRPILKELKEGKTFFLTSEGGLPAFFDPGQKLVELCHHHKIKVTATPFASSVALSVALSGFNHSKIMIEGFLPVKDKKAREAGLKNIFSHSYPSIVMETPYRFQRLMEEVFKMAKETEQLNREFFVGVDLNLESEITLRGKFRDLKKEVEKLGKREFVLIIGPK